MTIKRVLATTSLSMTLCCCFTVTACSSASRSGPSDGAVDSGTPEATGSDAAGADGANSGGPALPDSRVGRALGWSLGALNGASISEDDVTARFSASFLSQVPAQQLIEVVADLATLKPWTLVAFEAPMGPSSLKAVVTRGDGQYWRLLIETDASGAVFGLLLLPAGDLDPGLASWEAIDQAAAAIAPHVNMMAANVDSDACVPVHALAADSSLAIGSAFKLWVLARLAEDVRAGKHSWSETIPIDDSHKSLPSGVLQDRPAGTTLSLLMFANLMISISDNTAADHLLFFLGRDAVEAMLPLTGHHDPTQNQPFLSTRELFTLKLMATPFEQSAYLEAPVGQKRVLLTQYDAAYDPRAYQGPPWTEPKLADKLEWFASGADLCNVMRALRNYGDQPATQPVQDVLSMNPGLPDVPGAFSYVGFKGGSEPGVLNLTWLLRRKTDQRWVFLTMGFNDNTREVDAAGAEYLAGAARALMAAPPQ